PHIRPGHADLAARGPCPADPRRAPTSREGSAMAERFVGIDVALREHRIAVLDRDGEAVGQSFTIAANKDGVATLLRTLAARDATAAQALIGLGASGHLWKNLEAVLVSAGYRVLVLNPLQPRRYRDVVRRKAKTDDIDAHVIAGLLRSGAVKLGPTASPSRSRTAIRCSRNATSMPTNRSVMALPSREVGARRGSAGQVPP